MELPQRTGADRFFPSGRYKSLEEVLRANKTLSQVRPLVFSAFDRNTRMLPFVHFDWHMVPAGPRAIAASLRSAGMEKTRLVFQLWNPKLQPSRSQIDGAAADMLLISAMKVHFVAARQLIADAWSMGDRRPLIIAGGPKACYEPFDFFGLGHDGQIGADVVVTGEEPVLLELLAVLTSFGAGPGSMRSAFDRARQAGALSGIPGLVYSLDGRHDGKNLTNTGPQRLMRDLDDLPMPAQGFATLEPPHRRFTLGSQPIPLSKVCRGSMIAAVLVTRGCRFHCHYCPIPAYNMSTFRRKSPERMVAEFIDCRKQMNTRYFFGADDNFFNSRKYARELLEAMAAAQWDGKALGRQIRFATESTVIDVYKNRDLLPIARHGRAGMNALWLGVEDLAGKLIDKGQTSEITKELFAEMKASRISPMVMLMHHDDQPFHTPGKLVGLVDQIRFLYDAGAVGLQCTVASPAVGSKWYGETIERGLLYESVGREKIEDRHFDGNHVVACTRDDPWRIQLNMLRGYAAFYNPLNLVRSMYIRDKRLANKHLATQIWGMAALTRTAWKVKGHLWRLWRNRIKRVKDWPESFRGNGSPYTELQHPAIQQDARPTAVGITSPSLVDAATNQCTY